MLTCLCGREALRIQHCEKYCEFEQKIEGLGNATKRCIQPQTVEQKSQSPSFSITLPLPPISLSESLSLSPARASHLSRVPDSPDTASGAQERLLHSLLLLQLLLLLLLLVLLKLRTLPLSKLPQIL